MVICLNRGPAVIEQASSTTVVNPGQTVKVDEYGNLHIMLHEVQA